MQWAWHGGGYCSRVALPQGNSLLPNYCCWLFEPEGMRSAMPCMA